MRKSFVIALVASIVIIGSGAPLAARAVTDTNTDTLTPCTTDASGNVTCGNSSGIDVTDPALATVGLDSAISAAKSATAQCGDGSQGGAIGGIGGQLVGTLLNQVIPKGATGSEIRSLLSGNAGSAISQLAGGGTAGNIAGLLLNNSSVGNAVNSTVSGLTNQVLGGFSGMINGGANSVTSGITSGISSLFSGGSSGSMIGSSILSGDSASIANTAISSMLPDAGSLLGLSGGAGGVLGSLGGGALSSVTGALGGGGNVPVDVQNATPITNLQTKANTKLDTGNTQTKQIQDYQQQQVYVLCVQRPLIAAAANSFAAQFSSQVLNALLTGNGGNPYFQSGYPYDQRNTLDAAANWFTTNMSGFGGNSRFTPGAQQYFSNFYSQSSRIDLTCPVSGGVDSQACADDYSQCGNTADDRMRNHFIVETYNGCTQSKTNMVLSLAGSNYVNNRAAAQAELNTQAGGYLPKIKCLVPEGYTGPQSGCQAWQVVTPAGSVQDTANKAQNIGAEQQAKASELGQLVDSLFAQLASQALTSLSGLLGTSENRNGESSYLSQVSGSSSTASSGATTLRNNIEASMTAEASYEAVITDIITNLSDAQIALTSVQTCYLALSTSTTATLDHATAKAKADTASTTIATAITPQMNTQNDALTSSANVLAQLNNLDNLAQSAATADDVSNISNAYQALVSSGALHTTTDITNATNDDTSSKTILDALTSDANTALNQCKAGQ